MVAKKTANKSGINLKQNLITIIPDFTDSDVTNYYSWRHLLILARSLVRDKCMKVSIYSPEHKRFVVISTENVDNVFATARFGENHNIDYTEVLNYFTDTENNTKSVEQTMLYVYSPREDSLKSTNTLTSNQLKSFHGQEKHTVIFLCLYPSDLCKICKEWLPQNHFVLFSVLAKHFFLTDITKIMLDSLRNPNYNRYKAYNNFNYQYMEESRKFEIYLWAHKKGPRGEQEEMFFNTFVLDFLTTLFSKADVFMVLQLGNNYVATPTESFLFPNSLNADERWRDLKSHLKISNATAIHVNYEN